MRLERKSLLVCSLLLLTGCSAARHARSAASESVTADRVPMPSRHADEYDTGGENYEYRSTPSRGDESFTPPSSVPPAPLREPVPAPPAIGVSRVKSVSWLRRHENDSARNSCGDNTNVDGCAAGNISPLPEAYFVEGCDTPPQTTAATSLQSHEKTNMVKVVRGWILRRITPTPKQVRTPRNCGEQSVAAPGCYAPGGCTTTVQTFPPHDANRNPGEDSYSKNSGSCGGSLDERLSENGWEENATHRDNPGFTADELMDLCSGFEQRSEAKPQSVPDVPEDSEIEQVPILPIPNTAVPESPVPAPVEQQVNPNTVKTSPQPPMWPRQRQPAPKPANLPVAAPAQYEDATLPLIQPERRI